MSKQKALLIAEKPSLMKTICSVYNKHRNEIPYDIDFKAQAGHLFGLKMPDEINDKYKKWNISNYPMTDIGFEYKVIPGKGDLVKDLTQSIRSDEYDVIINAGDPDQEGELLIRETLNHAHNKKPVLRFWSNDLTEGAVLKALNNMEEDKGFYDDLYDAALVRQHEDYKYGLSMTPVLSIRQGTLTKIGRVKGAIISTLVDREKEIQAFKPHSDYKHSFIHKGYEFTGETLYKTEEEAEKTMPSSAEITEVKEDIRKIKAPRLYKLSTAQTDAYRLFKMNGKETLSTIQSLYEKGYVSYPRTDCEYISEQTDAIDIINNVGGLLDLKEGSLRNPALVMKDKTYFNNKAIAEEGHTGLIPTGTYPSDMTSDEQKVYMMILRRFVAIFAEPKTVHTVNAEAVDNKGENYSVSASEDIDAGFELILNPSYQMRKLPSDEKLIKGKAVPIKWKVKEIKAKCPARYTDGSLISALEKPSKKVEGVVYKIGTPATRANIIDEVGKAGYYKKEKGSFVATDFALKTVDNFSNLDLFDTETTGKWEASLEGIRKGELDADEVEKEMDDNLYQEIDEAKDVVLKSDMKEFHKGSAGHIHKMDGLKCPKCGHEIQETDKAYGCSDWKNGCKFTIWKTFMGAKITESDVEKLLGGGTIEKTVKSKAGKTWKQKLKLDNEEKIEFVR